MLVWTRTKHCLIVSGLILRYMSHSSDFTHESIGTFAEAMKYVAFVWLSNHIKYEKSLELLEPEQSPEIIPLQIDETIDADNLMKFQG